MLCQDRTKQIVLIALVAECLRVKHETLTVKSHTYEFVTPLFGHAMTQTDPILMIQECSFVF